MFKSNQSIEKAMIRIQNAASVYEEICSFGSRFHNTIIHLNNTPFFEQAIESFDPCLSSKNAKIDLKTVFDIALHEKSGAMIVANKGATIPALSPITSVSYITRHIACSAYHPHLGLESVNIGLVGNV